MGSKDDSCAFVSQHALRANGGCKALGVGIGVQAFEDIIEDDDRFLVIDGSGKRLA